MSNQSTRFVGPTAGLDLKHLLRKTRYILWISLVVAVVVHVVILVQSIQLGGRERVSKPLTVRFIQRAPRLTKPLELRKRPLPRRREMRRQRVNIQAKSPKLLTTYVGGIGISSLASGVGSLEQSWSIGDMGFRIGGVERVIATTKEPEHKIDLEASLLRLDDLDTGRYKAMIIQNPQDKRKIRGYFHLAELVSPSMLEHDIPGLLGGIAWGLRPNEFALTRLVEAVNTYTDIKVDFARRVAMADKELMDIPWVCILGQGVFYPTESELENLGRYLVSGGFLFIDAGSSVGSQEDVNFRDIVRRALAKVGRPCEFYKITSDHPIFHCYFDFDVVPTAGRGGFAAGRGNLAQPEYLIGVDVDRRLAVVFSYVSMGRLLHNADSYSMNEKKASNNQRLMQFIINTIVFALTQEGSITHRVMETIE